MNRNWKRPIAALLAALLLVSLAACGGDADTADTPPSESGSGGFHLPKPGQSADPEPDETDTPVIHRNPGRKPGGKDPEDLDAMEAYGELIEQFRAVAADPHGDWDTEVPGVMGTWEAASEIDAEGIPPLEAIGYCVSDLSGDGVPELAVASLSDYEGEHNPFGGQVYVLYTLVGGQPQAVFEGWRPNTYHYIGDGRFSYEGADGWVDSCLGTAALTKDGTELKVENFYFGVSEDDDPDTTKFYRNKTGEWDPEKSRRIDVTWMTFWDLVPEKPVDLPLTLFAELTDGGNTVVRPSTGPDAPVSVRYLDPERDETSYWVTLYDGPEATCVLFTTDSTVTKFSLLYLSLDDVTESGVLTLAAIPVTPEEGLDSLPEPMTPSTPVAVSMEFQGESIPLYGISYVDGNGDLRRFALSQSGYDGSLLMVESGDPDGQLFIVG